MLTYSLFQRVGLCLCGALWASKGWMDGQNNGSFFFSGLLMHEGKLSW